MASTGKSRYIVETLITRYSPCAVAMGAAIFVINIKWQTGFGCLRKQIIGSFADGRRYLRSVERFATLIDADRLAKADTESLRGVSLRRGASCTRDGVERGAASLGPASSVLCAMGSKKVRVKVDVAGLAATSCIDFLDWQRLPSRWRGLRHRMWSSDINVIAGLIYRPFCDFLREPRTRRHRDKPASYAYRCEKAAITSQTRFRCACTLFSSSLHLLRLAKCPATWNRKNLLTRHPAVTRLMYVKPS